MSVLDEDGVAVTRVRFRQRRFRWVTPYIRAVLRAAAEVRRSFPFEVVHAHCAFPAGLAALCVATRYRVPLVVTEHWAPYDQLMLSSRATALSIRTVVRRAGAVLAVSRSLRSEMEHWTQRTDIEVIPPAVDVTLFRGSPRARRGDDVVRLLFAGDLSHARKRLEDLLQAVRRLADDDASRAWRLEVIGDGELRPGYEALASSLGIAAAVRFRGNLELGEVASAMQECDVFAMPSTYETFGVVYAEALACGRPVVATRCGGPEDFVTDEVGRLVPPYDVGALARALREVADHLDSFSPERLRAYALGRFSHDVVGRQHEEIYRRLLP